MKTRLFTFLLIFILSASTAVAQSTDNSKMSFAIVGGVNFQNLTGKSMNGDKLSNDMLTGYHFGVNIQFPIASGFFFQPGLLYSTKGAIDNSNSLKVTTNLEYLELPLNLVYKGMTSNGHFMIGFGPYLAYGVGGKVTTETGPLTVKSDVEFKDVVQVGDDLLVPYFRRFDAGASFLAGYEMAGGLFIQLNADLGIAKINPEDKRIPNDKTSVKNSGFGVSLGYRF